MIPQLNEQRLHIALNVPSGGAMVTESRHLLCMTQNELLLDQISATFARSGYKLIAASSETGAISLLHEGEYDAVLLDVEGLNRQGMTGAFARLREHWHGPLVALIPEHANQEVVRAYEMGVDSHIVVPFDSRELAARVEAILRRVRAKSRGRQP